MFPHIFVLLETFVVFTPFFAASKAVPSVPMTVWHAECIRSTYEILAVDAPEMIDNFAETFQIVFFAIQVGTGTNV